ncbi:MAG TPA: hypothetical protein PKN33_00450 [Phycisphaerae bacterium]|nr:hypothetical protein [Phycisphaerae bacterium]
MKRQPTFSRDDSIGMCVALVVGACAFVIAANADADSASGGASDSFEASRRFDESLEGLTLSEIWAKGRARAEREYRDGWVEFDDSTGFMTKGHFAYEFGIYYRPHTFMSDRAHVEAHGHNDRVRQLIEEQGPPSGAKGLTERFMRLTKIAHGPKAFDWHALPAFDGKQDTQGSVTIGEYTANIYITHRESNIPDNDRNATIMVTRDSKEVALIPTYNRIPSAVALLPDLDILAVQFQPPHTSMEFIDLEHGRIMFDGAHFPFVVKDDSQVESSDNGGADDVWISQIRVRPVTMNPEFDGKSDAEIMQMGFDRAEQEYREGHVEREMFGLVIGLTNVDSALGIPYNKRGCTVTREKQIESDAYNERVTKLVAEKGAPGSMADLGTRYAAVIKINEVGEDFDWVPLPPPTTDQSAVATAIGPYHATLKETPNPSAAALSNAGSLGQCANSITELQIRRGSAEIATHKIYGDPPTRLSLLSDLDVLVIGVENRYDSIEYLDLRIGKVMLSENATSRLLKSVSKFADKARENPATSNGAQ